MYALQSPQGRALTDRLGQVVIYSTQELAQAVLDNDTLGQLDHLELEVREVKFVNN